MSAPEPYDAVVLAGGRARRMGGADKPAVMVGGQTLLDSALTAVSDAQSVVVVGPQRPTCRAVTWAREDPPGGGPVAALAAALPLVASDVVAVLAADLPFLDAATVQLLRTALEHDGALLVDAEGRDQLLVGVWRTEPLRRTLTPFDARLGAVLGRLRADRVVVEGRPWFDCDTEMDVAEARRHA
ncbi:MAG: molybdenum cofactor guanylyltransferase [Actinomycetes bacterium]